jgi:peptide/nickel transport system ATP-binding protein
MALLRVENLATHFSTPRGTVKAVDGVSFTVQKGEILGLIGESGCGKSTIGLSLMRLIDHPGKIATGRVTLEETELVGLSPEKMRNIRWKKIAMIPQSAMNALNPVLTIGEQIAEPVRLHMGASKVEATKQARSLLELVGIDPDRWNNYPHEFSGGMRQRVCIAMALACRPQLIISDEATTGLDVMTQAQVVGLIRSLRETMGLSLIFISHDLPLVLDICDRVAIMYAGQIVEIRSTQELRETGGMHPYTRGLMQAFPPLFGPRTRAESIPGTVPSLITPPSGCRFQPRCYCSSDSCCNEMPAVRNVKGGGTVACIHVDESLLDEEVSIRGTSD